MENTDSTTTNSMFMNNLSITETDLNNVTERLIKKLENNEKLKSLILKDVDKYSRTLQTFYESPEELCSAVNNGRVIIKFLTVHDVETMFPQFIDKVKSMSSNTYAYIFSCNSATPKNAFAVMYFLNK